MTIRIGICVKCGKEKPVQKHHLKGYIGENFDIVADYCNSCDQKAHFKARKEGKCNLTSKEARKLSVRSCSRRNNWYRRVIIPIYFCETFLPNVYLREQLTYHTNTGHVGYNAWFVGSNNKKIFYIDEV